MRSILFIAHIKIYSTVGNIQITAIAINQKSQAAHIFLPTGHMDFNLGYNELVINAAEWIEYNEKFNYRTPDNKNHIFEQQAQKVKLTISESIDSSDKLKLKNISVDVDKDQLNEYTKEGVKVIWDDPYADINPQDSQEENIEIVLSNIKDTQEEVDLIFYAPVYTTVDNVIIPLRP